MIVCKDLDTTFETKEELFKALKANKGELVYLKKSQIQKSADKGVGIRVKVLDTAKLGEANKELKIDDDFYYLAVNTTKILDSHSDLHINGLWKKTVKEQQGRNYLVLDHNLTVSDTVVRKEDIEMFTVELPFSMIGKSYEGNTEALIYKFRKEKIIHPIAKEWLLSGSDIEASVRMQYVTLDLAMKSEDEEDKEERRIYDKYISEIANKDDFQDINYFWVVKEAKNIRESSLVLSGSNGATGILDTKNIQPSKDTDKTETEAVTDTSLTDLLTHIKV